jgi:acyl carrier protein
MDIKFLLKQHIVTEMMHESNPDILDDDAVLIEGGYIDSMNLIQLIKFMEEKFGIKVEDDELDIVNFQTVNVLTGFVKKKLADS